MKKWRLFSTHSAKKLLVIVLLFVVSDVIAVRQVSVRIPTAVKRFDTVTLQCKYDLENEPLYTLKWYKGSKEFYRYIPKELPSTQVFPLPGVTVDVQKSTPNNLVLKNVQLEVTGRYKCEVSSDAPNFYTLMQSGYLYVVDVPVDDPILRIDKEILDTGLRLKGNCSSPPSYPSANITWLLNGVIVNSSYQQRVQPHDYNMKVTSTYQSRRVPLVTISGIDLGIDENNFYGGKAQLSCIANVFHLYRKEKSLIFDEDRPRPRPSSVLGTRDESSEAVPARGRFILLAISMKLISVIR
ncbi:uncharacterized protein LOC130901634 isoform X1 [Diorhabda carinulata]|uniref:uncharacterized protein LOC130901634 isoform X1 n=1 Tax=Diorhabda carinulata TaxID=1163345 RepID=UPI0025A2A90F|nr:uncharacterized protein LOC130901634 isoform X1 [Diorhabda carinulata]